MTTLKTLISKFDANAFVLADSGNGSAFGAAGQALEWDAAAAAQYGEIEMVRLDKPHVSNDGVECGYASDWQDGQSGYRFRIFF